MADRPGIVQKRLSPHHFIQLPDGDRDTDTERNRVKASNGGADAGASSSRDRNDTANDTPSSRRHHTGARKRSSMYSALGTGPYCHGAAYGPPILFSNGVATEKTGLVDVYGTKTRRSKLTRGWSSTDDTEDTRSGSGSRLARVYAKVMGYSTITRYAIYILPLGGIIAVPIILGATAARRAEIGGVKLYWFFAWIEVVWIGLWASKLVAYLIPGAVRALGQIASAPTGRHVRLLRELKVPMTLVCWTVTALVTFFPVMNLNPTNRAEGDTAVKSWQNPIKNLLFAFLICSLMFFAEKALIRAVSLCYYRTQFEAKTNECARVVEMLASLYGASRTMFPVYCREFRSDDAIMADAVCGADPVEGGRVRSTKPLKYFKGVRLIEESTPASLSPAHEFTKHTFGWNSARDAVIQALGRKKATEALARRIWMSYVVEGRYALYLEDIVEVLGYGREAEAQKCFKLLDRDNNGDVSLDEMVLTVAEFGHMRTSLVYSLHDVDRAINFLDIILASVALILGSRIVFFVTNTSTTAIAAGATALLGVCFLLSSAAHEFLGSCLLLFVKRPYDVGDRVQISQKSFVVQRISLLYTVFRGVVDNRTTQAANNVLNNYWIDNFSRANALREQLTIPVHFDTTFADIQSLREELELFVRDKENYRDFMPDIDIEVAGLGNMDRLDLRVDIRHRYNWSNESVRAARRSKFMCALVLALRKIGIRAPGTDEEFGPEKLFGSADHYEEVTGLLSGEVNHFGDPQSEQEHQTPAVRREPSYITPERLHPPPPSPVDGETRYQTPSNSPNKRLSANLNSSSRQSSTGWRKANGSTERVAECTRIITEPASLQRPLVHQGTRGNPYETYLSPHRRERRFSYEAEQSRSPKEMEQRISPVAGLTVQPKANPW